MATGMAVRDSRQSLAHDQLEAILPESVGATSNEGLTATPAASADAFSTGSMLNCCFRRSRLCRTSEWLSQLKTFQSNS